MHDAESQGSRPDRSWVSGEGQYDVACFARKHRITMKTAREIIQMAGPSRAQADAAAERIKRM